MNKYVKELVTIFDRLLKEYDPKTAPFDLEEYEITYKQMKETVKYIKEKEDEINDKSNI